MNWRELLFTWIKEHNNEPIPENLKMNDNWYMITNNHKQTPLMYWIIYRKNEPIPEDMKCPGW